MERSNSVNKELNEDDIQRYKRHISLKEIGILGQKKLKNSSVLFIGAGGLGSSAILYACAAGTNSGRNLWYNDLPRTGAASST